MTPLSQPRTSAIRERRLRSISREFFPVTLRKAGDQGNYFCQAYVNDKPVCKWGDSPGLAFDALWEELRQRGWSMPELSKRTQRAGIR